MDSCGELLRTIVFDPGLALYLRLHESDGSSFASKDAAGCLCTVTGAVWSAGGRDFDGLDDYIAAGLVPSYANGYTVDFWVKNTLAEIKPLFGDQGGNSNSYGVSVWVSSGKARALGSKGTPGVYNFDFSSLSGINDGGWHHVAVTWTGDTQPDGVKLYVNSLLESQATAVTGITGTNALDIGRDGVTYGASTIGEVRVYRRALTPLEIQRNYLATKWRYR